MRSRQLYSSTPDGAMVETITRRHGLAHSSDVLPTQLRNVAQSRARQSIRVNTPFDRQRVVIVERVNTSKQMTALARFKIHERECPTGLILYALTTGRRFASADRRLTKNMFLSIAHTATTTLP